MERAQIIRDLRKPTPIFPPAWPPSLKSQRAIIISMINHNPLKRPTASELLKSDLIPTNIEERSFDEFLRLASMSLPHKFSSQSH